MSGQMADRARVIRMALVILGVCAVTGCSVLEPKPDTSRYFLLRAVAEEGPAPLDDLVLGLGPVTVPDYLDRSEMLDLVGPYELRYSADNRWIEPLGGQLRQTLADNLRTTLRPDAIVEYPWYTTDPVTLEVGVTFSAIRLDEGGVWRGSATWVLRDAATARALERADYDFELGRDAVPPEDVARRLSEEMAGLAAEIAAGVRRHHSANQER